LQKFCTEDIFNIHILENIKRKNDIKGVGSRQNKEPNRFKIEASESSHYSKPNVAGWLGIGTKNLVTIPSTTENEMSLIHALLYGLILARHADILKVSDRGYKVIHNEPINRSE
jgi:hypothetical protein